MTEPDTAHAVRRRRKLIEVALPLDAINAASAREKSIRHGHPSTLHLWWARRPLAAARAVIFAQMVDDPSEYVDVLLSDPERRSAAKRELNTQLREREARVRLSGESLPGSVPTLEGIIAERERRRLCALIEDLVRWDNTNNEELLERARSEIWQSWRRTCAENADNNNARELFDRERLPGFHDPFAGGGALPLEAQRLGMEPVASDLNPVAVLINKALVEVPPLFSGRPPVNPKSRESPWLVHGRSRGARGLAEDVLHYGKCVYDDARTRLGPLYPKIRVTTDMVRERDDLVSYRGRELPVLAWIWARTVKSPNPAFAHVDVPLASTFLLSTKKRAAAFVTPEVEGDSYSFKVRSGVPADQRAAKRGTKSGGSHSSFLCLMSSTPMPFSYLREESKAGRMGVRLMAIVAKGDQERVYLSPTKEHEALATHAPESWKPDLEISHWPGRTNVVEYGLRTFGDLFTSRQLHTLNILAECTEGILPQIENDALASGLPEDPTPLREGGGGARAYAEAVGMYLAMAVSKETVFTCTQARWRAGEGKSAPGFGRQALPMVWDFAEVCPFAGAGGDFLGVVEGTAKTLLNLPHSCAGAATQSDAATQSLSPTKVISTDPPYYDNIGYADLSDFFYVWLRRTLRGSYPDLFATVAVPKAAELVAMPYRHGGRDEAEAFFMSGMKQAMTRLVQQGHPALPVTIYYAFKQAERKGDEGTSSTGWETFLDAVIHAGFGITGTWPMRTESASRMIGQKTNALASSIVLVCQRRSATAPSSSRREFLAALRAELPAALAHLQRSNIAPVDLAQAAIGPGMAVYTRYGRVLESDGSRLSVRTALALINQVLDEVLAEQEGDFDPDTRWALSWFEQFGFGDGEFGTAETLSKAKNTSVRGLKDAGILTSKSGKVRLLAPAELSADWDPSADNRTTVWEMVHHIIRTLNSDGEGPTAALVARMGVGAEAARELAYRLYAISEREKRPGDALGYNALVQAWPELVRLASGEDTQAEVQGGLFDEGEG